MDSVEERADKLELIARKDFEYYKDMYKVVDFLNKNLKEYRIMLGLRKDKENNRLSISIYEF